MSKVPTKARARRKGRARGESAASGGGPSATVEDYLKTVYSLTHGRGADEALVGDIASALGVTPGTVTTMVKRLAAGGLGRSRRYGGVRLTAKGAAAALAVIRRHRLIETFLVRTLGLDWADVHDEAERIEHALSEFVIDALDRFLGRPTADPHGDPIPGPEGAMEVLPLAPLAAVSVGTIAVIRRMATEDPAFLRFAAEHGLMPGVRVTLVSRDDVAGAVTVKAEGRGAVTMSLEAGGKLLVDGAGRGRG